jgi:ABC-type antimicrobial peptide transport system ATPase subunit
MTHALSDLPDQYDHRIQTLRMLLQEDAYVINIRHLASKIMDFEIALNQAQNDPR